MAIIRSDGDYFHNFIPVLTGQVGIQDCFVYTDSGGLIFTEADGSPVNPVRFSKQFERAVKAAGLPRIPLHGLRHTWATIALSAGIHPKVVSERLDHATISLTLDTYSDVLPGLQEEAAAKVAALVLSG